MQAIEFSCKFYPLELEIQAGMKKITQLFPSDWEKISSLKEKLPTMTSLGSVQWEVSRVALLLVSADLFSVRCLSFRMPLRPLQKVLLKHLSTLLSCLLRTMWTREYLVTGRIVFSVVQSRKGHWVFRGCLSWNETPSETSEAMGGGSALKGEQLAAEWEWPQVCSLLAQDRRVWANGNKSEMGLQDLHNCLSHGKRWVEYRNLEIVALAKLWIWASVFLFTPAWSLCSLGPSSRRRWLSTAEPFLEICCWQSRWKNTQ